MKVYKLIQNIETHIVCKLSMRNKATRFLNRELRIREDNGTSFLLATWPNNWRLPLVIQNSWVRSPRATPYNYNFAWTFDVNSFRILTQCSPKKTNQWSESLKTQDLHTNNTRDKEYIELDIESEDIELRVGFSRILTTQKCILGYRIYYSKNRI